MQGTGSFRLIVRRGPQPNQIYELNKDIITLGRDITNDIVINDPEVSRHHSRITRGGGGYTLEDLGSTNGTFVNGQRLTGARPLSSGDLVSLGETVTLVYETGVPGAEAVQPPPVLSQMPTQPQQQGASPRYQEPTASYPQTPSYQYSSQAPTQQPYGQQYSPPPPPPPQYQYQEQPASTGGGLGRWFFLGCGFLIVLCIVLTVVAVLYIDANDLYCRIPILRDLVGILGRRC